MSYLEGGITKEQLASKLETNVKSYCSSTSGPRLTYIGFAFERTSSEPIDITTVSLEAILDASLYAIYTYDEGTKVLYLGNSTTGSVRNGGITGTGVSYLYYFNYEHLRSYLKSYIGKQTSSGVVEAILDGNTVIDLETYEPKSNSYLTFKYVTT